MGDDLAAALDAFLARHETELIELRRDLHAHPEPANAERRTTEVVAERLARAGLRPVLFSGSTGLQVDIGHGEPRIALRADLDALPMDDEKSVSYRSTIPGFCHACGHDAHTAMLVGAGEFLAELAASRPLRGGVRLIFQPAEETASGAKQVIAAGALDGVSRIFALHCDPRLDVGKVGIRAGAITAACDKIRVTLAGPGGHTARPHLTADVVYALAKVVTEVPAALTRRVDPRAGLSLVWGHVNAGMAANAIPDGGIVEGTLRCLDAEVWRSAAVLIEDLVQSVAAPYGVIAKVEYLSAVPPTVNEVDQRRPDRRRRLGRARPGRGDGHAAEPRRRGLRLVPGHGARRHGEDRHARTGRAGRGRPASAGLRHRRAGDRCGRARPRVDRGGRRSVTWQWTVR